MRLNTVGVLCIAISFFPRVSHADENQVVWTIAEFNKLSRAQQEETIAQAFRHRMECARNVYYDVDIAVATHEFANGHPGQKVTDIAHIRSRFRHWILNEKYRMEIRSFRPDAEKPSSFVNTTYDFREGAMQSFLDRNNRKFGRLDVTQERVMRANHYMHWFVGTFPNEVEYIFPYALAHQESWEIKSPVKGNKVHLAVDYRFTFFDEDPGEGKRVYILDPEKGFLPIEGDARWDRSLNKDWRIERFRVEKSALVGDIWMPIEITSELAVGAGFGRGNVIKTKVNDIEYGSVVDADVELVFPEDTQIVDAIKGITYMTDAKGAPIQSTVEKLYDLDPSQAVTPEVEEAGTNYYLVIVGSVMIASALFFSVRKKMARR